MYSDLALSYPQACPVPSCLLLVLPPSKHVLNHCLDLSQTFVQCSTSTLKSRVRLSVTWALVTKPEHRPQGRIFTGSSSAYPHSPIQYLCIYPIHINTSLLGFPLGPDSFVSSQPAHHVRCRQPHVSLSYSTDSNPLGDYFCCPCVCYTLPTRS